MKGLFDVDSRGLDNIHEPFGVSELSGKVPKRLGVKIGSWQTCFFLCVFFGAENSENASQALNID